MGQQISLEAIVGYFANIAMNHDQIESFYYGPKWDVSLGQYYTKSGQHTTEAIYPIMVVIPEKSKVRNDSIVLVHTIQILDQIQADATNRIPLLSDNFQTLLDIRAYIQKDFSVLGQDIFPTDVSDIEPYYENYDDKLAGWSMGLELQLDWLADVCSIPGLVPTGATFNSSGGGYFNINLANYLPLVGGSLSGPLYGPLISATTISGTTIYGNQIYLSGTPLSQIFLTINAAISSATTIVQNGVNTYTGGTELFPSVNVVANPLFTSVSASTFSGTTYLGLPRDIYITGGTYSSLLGITTLTNNTGGTFTVAGYYTGYTAGVDIRVTGGTYNNSTGIATFTNNTGGTFNVIGFDTAATFGGGIVSGATVFTGGLSANTFSASTYQNLPNDIYVTGGTYSNGTLILTNDSGGTFSVTGFSQATGSSFTGGTVTGATNFTNGLTANTFSASTYLNLPNLNNDYFVLSGTSGGQTAIGGPLSGDTLVFRNSSSSANTTTGNAFSFLVSSGMTAMTISNASVVTITNNPAITNVPLQINFPSANGQIQLSRTGSNAGSVSWGVSGGGGCSFVASNNISFSPNSLQMLNLSTINTVNTATLTAAIAMTTAISTGSTTSGQVQFSMPFNGPTYKKVVIYFSAASGTTTYSYPIAFTHLPAIIIPTSGVTAGNITNVTLTGVTASGSSTTGWAFLEGY